MSKAQKVFLTKPLTNPQKRKRRKREVAARKDAAGELDLDAVCRPPNERHARRMRRLLRRAAGVTGQPTLRLHIFDFVKSSFWLRPWAMGSGLWCATLRVCCFRVYTYLYVFG